MKSFLSVRLFSSYFSVKINFADRIMTTQMLSYFFFYFFFFPYSDEVFGNSKSCCHKFLFSMLK